MIFGLGWKVLLMSIIALLALTFILRLAGCNVLVL